MSDESKNPLANKLVQQKRMDYQAIIQKEINSNFTDAEQRALKVKCMVLLVESYLPDEIKDQLHSLHLDHQKYNQPAEELVN
tara:strand:- start:95 stop:340 length:246 start_codon:yes stop_codon:yes gene_type:complete